MPALTEKSVNLMSLGAPPAQFGAKPENLQDTENSDWEQLYQPGNVYTPDSGFVVNPEEANRLVAGGVEQRIGYLTDVGNDVDELMDEEDLCQDFDKTVAIVTSKKSK